ncbi:hypothetical protein BT67DRAFT_463174 [Trichocladium antarcticum]|uniref:Uncharacterized protein n=1 Tax=Trichocladium antarcticum TaxID=1450529 RepID=A0AAN6UHQ4_9PEZI|nr:hypothetical protein BT67DRAFT_463174 [Trichocladium antarcticum]
MTTPQPPTTGTSPPPTPLPLPSPLLRAMHASDQAMYPAAPPYARLRTWVAACPALSVRFWDAAAGGGGGGADVGVIIVLPLRRACWEQLLCGAVKEGDVEVGGMFPSGAGRMGMEGGEGKGEEVGLHVYHVEKFAVVSGESGRRRGLGGGGKGFAEFALGEVMRRVEAGTGWRVVGLSALTATAAGKRTFERMGFKPTGYRELFVAKAAQGAHADASGTDNQQVEMVCLYPGGETGEGGSEKGADGVVVSASEMTVKYSV